MTHAKIELDGGTARRGVVLLDRDGVINRDAADYIKTPDEWVPLAGSLEAIAALCGAGFRIIVVSNQSGIGRGLLAVADLDAIHAKMRQSVRTAGGRLSGIYYCPHRPDEGCRCRKPAPGLLEEIAVDFRIALAGVPFIGDKLTDARAAQTVGARPILVQTGLHPVNTNQAAAAGIEVHATLREAAAALLTEGSVCGAGSSSGSGSAG